MAKIPMSKEIYLSLKDPWDDELIGNETLVDLARPGIEHFYVKHPLKFTINKHPYKWKSQYITGEQLRHLGDVNSEDDLYLKFNGHYEDELIVDETRVDLARPGIEQFYSKKADRKVALIVNGKPKEWNKSTITFEQVVVLAFGSISNNPNVCYTVTYKRGPHQNPEGSMVRGDVVYVKNKMVFNVTATDKS
jgi:hypothetical protein